MRVTSSLSQALTPSAVALGNFDGLHRGHCKVIAALREFSLERSAHLTVVAFDPHPQAFFSGQPQLLLTPLEEKAALLEQLGIEQLVLLTFDEALAQLSPPEFVEQILVQQLAARCISVGFNFGFGRQRSGTTADLDAIASQYKIPVNIATPQTAAAAPISSSAIRAALQDGQLDQAQQMLGRPYTLTGTVVEGQHLGATLGFPTANLKLPEDKFLPRQGVYSVGVTGPSLPQAQKGVMNLGCRPTVDGTHQVPEVHLLDWSSDLYGHTITVSLEQFLRPEQKFDSLDALKAQIQQDCKAARAHQSSVMQT
ncbi:Riboflavin biosynthesis protein RibF [Acaryochloris thomasi RCC1774]|uniref:Riboflavin biosynthesis protein n=1 Tax=Acaryochloris thomasi RCC1774 TaxID=1764569 RepID=A0A2W1K119_9CYAN|nr:bifunctional riboflavin kinase/FAD synthetase [Acaryochloris thomasi]PZD75184.1 Riboflavin biosynthesis protein RibF [Acaryochloris thomasi RCC1774]